MTNLNQKIEKGTVKLFESAYRTFIKKVAEVNGVTVQELVEFSNSDDQLRKDLEQRFLLSIKEQA
jgi:hypothetical protein|tara:strand:- start:257 stop:451 length:195 start_codon:yes stop_codon:yes gene_type:complete